MYQQYIKALLDSMSSWRRDVFLAVNEISSNDFALSEVYAYRKLIASKHPNNKHVDDKIRQILQNLRDMGLIKFVSPGHYRKLFKIKI